MMLGKAERAHDFRNGGAIALRHVRVHEDWCILSLLKRAQQFALPPEQVVRLGFHEGRIDPADDRIRDLA